MHRRDFVRLAAGAAAAGIAAPAWAAAAAGGPRRLVVVFLRGAVDGLNVVVPYHDDVYYAARPTIAIPRPGADGGGLRLDDRFALHPALAGLMPLWQRGQLAFVHAAGSPDPTRSHFDAQLFIENGTPGHSATPDGWMNRLLAALPAPHGPTEAVSVGATLPHILAGREPVANLPLGPQAARPLPIDRPEIGAAFDRLYAGNGAIGAAYRQGRLARTELIGDMTREQQMADNGAPPANTFPALAERLARLIGQDRNIRLAFASLGGWDTHVGQGNQAGQLANHLRPLADGLAALAQGLGRDWDDTVVAVVSEFGRTVHENGDGGTDHGHGNVLWLLGGKIAGGKVYGNWPGLAAAQLYQNRDLAVTTDYRAAFGVLVQHHLGLGTSALARIFPGMPAISPDLAAIIAA